MKRTLSMVLAISLVGVVTAWGVMAGAPVINITSPTEANGTYFVPSFSHATSIQFTIQDPDGELDRVGNLKVGISDGSNTTYLVGDAAGGVNAFSKSPGNELPFLCTSNITSIVGLANCSINGSQASVSVPWTVPEAGTYVITVSAKRQSDVGSDTETVEYEQTQVVNVEYPAPPAVANAYIKQRYGKLSAARRGCVISEIAKQAQQDVFGARPGPYATAAIESAVDAWVANCTQ